MNNKYREYLLSNEWVEMKLDLIQSRGCKCEDCNKPKLPNKLQLHHKNYERIFNELPSDLILLCAKCHMKQHKDIIPKSILVKFGIKEKRVHKKKVKKKKQKLTMFQVVEKYRGSTNTKAILRAYKHSIKNRRD